MLLTAVALLGFASSPGGGPDPADAVCADTPDFTMIGITGGSTCADLAGEGRCTSTDGLVAKVMERNCKASCGGCGETRASRAYVVMGDEGDYSCKEYGDPDAGGLSMMPLSQEAAEEKVCGTCFARLMGEDDDYSGEGPFGLPRPTTWCSGGYATAHHVCFERD